MGIEDGKDSQPNNDEIEYDPDDIRSILLAERVDKIYRQVRENKPIRGKESEYRIYQRMAPIRTIAMLVLLFQILFSKPLWCRDKGQNIDDNCRKDTNDVNYFRSKLPVFDTGMDTYINVFCLLLLAISRLYRLRLNNSSDDAVSASVTCFVLAMMYICLKILHSMGGFLYINIEDILTMLFILIYNDSIRRAAMRLVKIAVESIEILIIFASVLLAFACLARVIFFDYDEVKDFDYNFASFNYGSFSSSFYSMIVTVSTTSFPGNMLKAYKSSRPFAFFYILNTFVVNMIMLNLILATFYFYYQNFYTESVKKLNSKKNLLFDLYVCFDVFMFLNFVENLHFGEFGCMFVYFRIFGCVGSQTAID